MGGTVKDSHPLGERSTLVSNSMPLPRYRRTPERSTSSMIPNLSLASLMSFARAFSSDSSVSTLTARVGCRCPLMRAASRSDVADMPKPIRRRTQKCGHIRTSSHTSQYRDHIITVGGSPPPPLFGMKTGRSDPGPGRIGGQFRSDKGPGSPWSWPQAGPN